ncbi:MAG TPA: PIG-L family deacetylase [Vicinamibacterales bacterium]|nr:PIG-L family deacetylase [Vicinamibacterales bacterium]
MASLIRCIVVVAGVVALGADAVDRSQAPTGAAAVWEKIRKLETTASVMHTTAHPDDEHGGLLALLSRGRGVHVSMLTLTRGESGDNAIGPELFDALGLIRTEELLLANRYYGVDRQYFTSVVDYGFSKRLDETLEKWGREPVLSDVVRIIRTERPLVLISRFQGNERDGHGNHQAAGLITQEAFKAAGDPAMFPEQLSSGLQPWQPLKLYMGGVRANEDWTIRVDTGEYDPVIGESYQTIARLGLSFQRSQNGGRFVPQFGSSFSNCKRLAAVVDAPAKEESFFDGIDVTIPGVYRALRKDTPSGAEQLLAGIDRHIKAAVSAFSWTDPSTAVPALARALAATRAATRTLRVDEDRGFGRLGQLNDVSYVLARKEEQLQEAITAALGITVTGVAQPVGTPDPAGPFAAPPEMGPVVPGQTIDVRTTFISRGPKGVKGVRVGLAGRGDWKLRGEVAPTDAAPNQPVVHTLTVTVPADAPLTRPHFSRSSIQEARYTIEEATGMSDPRPRAPLEVLGHYEVDGVPITVRRPVTRLEANLPYGYDTRVLAIVPTISITATPEYAIVPMNAEQRTVSVKVEVLNNGPAKAEGTIHLDVPPSWTVEPSQHRFAFARAGERSLHAFAIRVPALEDRVYRVAAIARSGDQVYRTGYTAIRHRDLETRYLYRDATTTVRGVDVTIAPGLEVGYVMGIGDEVPAGLAQLGVDVQLLGRQDLATADLSRFDAIMTGTRAYAVREDLKTYNRRLLDYVREGGNLIVLYNTQEFVPNEHAPYPADLPRNAEEVSEEDSPVEIVEPSAAVFTTPNRITKADFDGWVEQRGSKFWTTWDPRYTPMIATWDKGQPPQKGGWLHARYGKGHYTYFAYAFHRQLPYGVPGAYRLLANLLSLKSSTPSGD